MLDLLLNPNKFFKDRANTEPEIIIPMIIMLVSGIISGINAYVVTGILKEAMPEEIAQLMVIGQMVGFVGAVIMAVVIWFVFSAIFYGLSKLFKGTGSFKKVLEITGYGYVPWLFGTILSTAVFLSIAPSIHIPPFDLTDPEQAAEAGNLLKNIFTENSYLLISWVVGIIFIIWAANLWIFGVFYTRKIKLKFAVITVALPVAIYIFYSAYGIGVL